MGNPNINEANKDTRFKPGNPGRPKGSRQRLTEKFITAIHDDFAQHGAKAIEDVRNDDPSTYLRVVASLVPKELEIKRPLADMSDEELADAISLIRTTLGSRAEGVGAGGAGQAVGKPH